METTSTLSMERQFELARQLSLVDGVDDISGLREVTKELLKLHFNQKHHYEQLLAKQWGL